MENTNQEQQPINTYKKGRGAQINTKNKFITNEVTKEHIEALSTKWKALM
jgi:hypothetical protein